MGHGVREASQYQRTAIQAYGTLYSNEMDVLDLAHSRQNVRRSSPRTHPTDTWRWYPRRNRSIDRSYIQQIEDPTNDWLVVPFAVLEPLLSPMSINDKVCLSKFEIRQSHQLDPSPGGYWYPKCGPLPERPDAMPAFENRIHCPTDPHNRDATFDHRIRPTGGVNNVVDKYDRPGPNNAVRPGWLSRALTRIRGSIPSIRKLLRQPSE